MLCIAPPRLAPGRQPDGVAYRPQLWPPDHRTVTVRLLTNDAVVRERVQAAVETGWNRASGLQFVFVEHAPADVRVGFAPGASWSHVGAYCLGVQEPEPTLNLGWVNRETAEREVRRVVLHEFGHTMGLLHEQENPNAQIPWDIEAVYAWYAARGWSRAMVDAQVLNGTAPEVCAAGTYDAKSIMHYYIPPELVLDRVARGGNGMLSAGDVAMAQWLYGPAPERAVEVFLPVVRRE